LLILVAAGVMLAKHATGRQVGYPLVGSVFYYLDYFLCGLLLADWHVTSQTSRPISRVRGLCWDLVGLIAAAGCIALPMNWATWYLLPIALLPACAAALRGPRLNRLLSQPLLVVIGGMCYTTYLYHFGVISLIGRFVAPWTTGLSYPAAFGLQAMVVVPAILAFSAIPFLLIEKPCMAWGRKPVQPALQPA
jgi:peptidoglycan/LPS O-acetylase OafA/YrhL